MSKHTDTELLDWLQKNLTYMEHGPRESKVGGYFPQSEGETYAIEEQIGLTLREYVDEMIEKEKK